MAFADLPALRSEMNSQRFLPFGGAAGASIGAFVRLSDTWGFAFGPSATLGPTPTASVALSDTSEHALNYTAPNFSPRVTRLIGADIGPGALAAVSYIMIDRLCHSGGLSGTDIAAQTTNLPTAALPRFTSGEGVQIGLRIWTAIGTTASSVTVSYTNQSNVSGRTTPAVQIGGANFREAGRVLVLPLQAGDTGVRSVESVTLGATTGTAGDFGVMLFRPLAAVSHSAIFAMGVHNEVGSGMFGCFPDISSACLSALLVATNAIGDGPGRGVIMYGVD